MERKLRKHIYIAAGVSLVAFLAAAFSFMRVPSKEAKNADWMKNLSNSSLLSEISLPGSHDSGATHSLYEAAGKCQDATIEEQLNAGARFLDIRLRSTNDTLSLFHGSIDQELSFASVLDSCYSFLDAHQSEAIIMSIQKEQESVRSSKTFEEDLQAAIAPKLEDYWYTKNETPTLGQVRSRIVLLSRYEAPTIGLNCQASTWVINDTFDMDNGVKFHIQDHYKVGSNSDKWDSAKSCFSYSASLTSPKPFVINFMSGYLTTFPLPVAAPTAHYVNPLVAEEVAASSFTGIVLFDFFTSSLASAIIGANA